MADIVKFDWFGDRRLVFEEHSVTYVTKERYPLAIPGLLGDLAITTNRPIAFQDIRRISRVRRRQWWALVMGLLFAPLGLLQMGVNFRDPGGFCVSAFVFLALGVFPLWLFVRGRSYLAIASEKQAIFIPMDRKKKQLLRALTLLGNAPLPADVRWDVEKR